MIDITTSSGEKTQMPQALYNFYKRILGQIGPQYNEEKVRELISSSFDPNWHSMPNLLWSEQKKTDQWESGPGADALNGMMLDFNAKFPTLTWSTEQFDEAVQKQPFEMVFTHTGFAASTVAEGNFLGGAPGKKFEKVLAIDRHTLTYFADKRTEEDCDGWLVTHSYHVEMWGDAIRQVS